MNKNFFPHACVTAPTMFGMLVILDPAEKVTDHLSVEPNGECGGANSTRLFCITWCFFK